MTSEHETTPSAGGEESLRTAAAGPVSDPPAEPTAATGPGKRAVKGKSRPVLVYVTVMFAAAVLLLVLSFFMQQRNHDAIMKGLSSSQINAQSVVDLELENNKLDERIHELETQLATAATDEEKLQADLDTAQKSRQAMDWLLGIQQEYEDGDFVQALKLVAEFTATGLPEYLPQTSAITEGYPQNHPEGSYASPAQRFEEIQKALS